MSRVAESWTGAWSEFKESWILEAKKRWGIFLLYAIVSGLIFVWFDEPILAWLQGMELGLGQEKWTAFCKWLKVYSDFLWFNFFGALLILALGFLKKSEDLRRAAFAFFLAAAMAGIAVQTAKTVFGRPRPSTLVKSEEANSAYDFRGPTVKGGWRAYPSGHSAAVWASCVALGLRFRRLLVPLLGFACLVAWSRVYGNYHWPTDVLHGSGLGATFGYFWGQKKPGR